MHTPPTTAAYRLRVIESQQTHSPDTTLPVPDDAQSRRFAALLRLHRDASRPPVDGEGFAAAAYGEEQHARHAEEADRTPAAWPGGDIVQSHDQPNDGQRGEQQDEASDCIDDPDASQAADASSATAMQPATAQMAVAFSRPASERAHSSIDPPMHPQRVDRLIHSIATRVADFCVDPAVLSRGEWRISIPLDAMLLPDCTLDLTLSDFKLTLRFSTASNTSANLISEHVDVLKNSLETLLQARQIDRAIDITIT